MVASASLPAQGDDSQDRHELIKPGVQTESAARALLEMKLGRARTGADFERFKQLLKKANERTISKSESEELQTLAMKLSVGGYKDLSAKDQEQLANDLKDFLKSANIKPPPGSAGCRW